jgi:hypothetical protein
MNREWLFENENPEGRASVVLKAPSKGSPDGGAAWLAAAARAPGAGRWPLLPGSPFTNLSGSQESGTGESDSGHSRYMCTGPGCESGHVRLTMACNITVGRDCALPLAGSTSPDFDCRGFFTRAIAR